MKELEPSIGDWRLLYAAAVEFKKLKCWEWMLDSNIFGIKNPANGEVGYCCITGYLGEHFALVIYLGTEGLEIYRKAQNGRVMQNPIEIFANQKCLMASFEDRETLTNDDRATIKELELRFRGQNQWPQFRSYQPGEPAWYITRDEAEYLTLALQQATEMALRFKEDPDMLTPPKEDHYLVRVSEKADDEYQWADKWLRPAPLKKKPKVKIPPVNEIRLQKIKNTIKRRGGSWEIDFFFAPTPIKEESDDRPYYPYAILCVDSLQGLVLNVEIVKPDECATALPNGLMGLIENIQVIPNDIMVSKEEAFDLLNLIASRLGIRLELVEKLKEMEQAQFSMLQFFR